MSEELEEHCGLLREWLSMAGVEKADIREMAARQMAEKVRQHFDASRMDSLEEEPGWLAAMCGDARWRTLLYELCAAYPHCALLQATVRGLSQGEHAAEITAHPSLCTLIGSASSLQSFVNSLGVQLRARLGGQATAQETLNGMACAGEVQFFCSQLLMRSTFLTDLPSSAAVEESLGITAEASARAHRQPSRRLQLLAAGVRRQSALMSCLVSVLSAGAISSADAHTLSEQCESGADVAVLCQPWLLTLLLQSLFDPSRPPKAGARELLLRVLAHVAHAADDRAPSDRASLECMLALLRESQALCERNEVSEIVASATALQRCAAEPAAACGVLLWARVNLTSQRYSGARYNSSYMPVVLRLIGSIAHAHVALRGAIGELLHACLVHEPPADSEHNALATITLRRRLLDCLLILLSQGSVLHVLRILSHWICNADLSLVRHAIQQLLALVAPPYSEAFAGHVLAMLRQPRVLEAHRSVDAKKPLIAFASEAANISELQGVARETLGLLQAAS